MVYLFLFLILAIIILGPMDYAGHYLVRPMLFDDELKFLGVFLCFFLAALHILVIKFSLIDPIKENINLKKKEEEYQKRMELYQKVKISQLDYLQPKAFEEWTGKLFKKLGYNVQILKRNQHFGIDIILKNSNKIIGVQAVRNNNTVGIQPVKDAIQGINYHKCDQAWVITNAKYYSKNAISYANQNNVLLIACDNIVSLLEKLDMDTNFKSLNPQNNTLVPQKYITAKMPFIKKINE